jgi:sRNA-binding protein
MKKILSTLLAVTILFAGISAHAQTTDSAKAAKKAARAEKKAEKAKAAAAATTTTPAVKPAPAPTPATPAVKPAAPKTVTQGVNKTADKAVGTDAKGRTIYEGPKGGRYTLTAAGNKEYIKKTN